MEKLVQIIISDEFQGSENQPPIILNPNIAIGVPVIPTAYSLAITVLTVGIDFKNVKDAKLKLAYCSPKNMKNRMIIQRDLSREIDFNSVPEHKENSLNTTNFNFNMRNLLFKEEGKIRVEFTIDDDVFKQEFIIMTNGGSDD